MFTARVPGELAYRDVVGAVVRGVCRHVERAARCSGLEWRVVSAFNEAFNNVALHAYGDALRGEVRVVLRVEPAELVIEIEDDGRGFDFEDEAAREPPPPEALDAGGMGLFIMRRTVTRVSYRRGRSNRLTLAMDLSDGRARGGGAASDEDDDEEGSPC